MPTPRAYLHRRYRQQRCQAARPGQALVEAAITFPLLLLVGLGLIQFALFVHAEHVMIGAVQDGARVATTADGSLGRGLAHTRQLIDAGLGRNAGAVAVTGQAGSGVITIEAHGTLHLIVPWVADAGLPLRARALSQQEAFRVGP